ncbi:hypothetical protein TTHT_0694 [Thermotomaculum hydrothermale]|uniref:Tetratricopeptide repeat protein n=1 Tax=Thermotomaculum hydrothermale TaxID=981385 RepID=A0A7R6SY75_9BACT|nr:tetratricopeptide repeat protein [Thermotomaculum hydrothermale]BBB32266.1 hypothetical protein TTHT_0694 [Thermotomaculum hydrothermale]
MKKIVFALTILLSLNLFAGSIHQEQALTERLKTLLSEQKYPLYYSESFMALCNDWKNTNLMFFVADGYDKLGNLYREKSILLRALKLTPEDTRLKDRLNDVENRINKIEKKIEMLEQKPKDLQVYLQLAAIYIGLKDLSNARNYLSKAGKVESSRRNIIHKILYDTYTKQIEIPTKQAINMSMNALTEYENGNKEKAYSMFRDALAFSISSPFVYDNLAEMLIREKNYGGAIRALEESFELQKDASKAIDLGNLYFLMKDYNEAFNYFEQATKLNGNASEAYYNMALCLEKLGDKKGADEYYKIAFRQNPKLKELKKKGSPIFIKGIKIETGKNTK